MKRILHVLAVTLIVGLLATVVLPAVASGADDRDGSNGGPAANLPPGSAQSNSAQVLCTMAVNSDGTKAGSLRGATPTRIGTGQYEVPFGSPCFNITAVRGWARWVQPDTLTTGSLGSVSCTTADRAGNPNAVFVRCTNQDGAVTDTSFFIFVAR